MEVLASAWRPVALGTTFPSAAVQTCHSVVGFGHLFDGLPSVYRCEFDLFYCSILQYNPTYQTAVLQLDSLGGFDLVRWLLRFPIG